MGKSHSPPSRWVAYQNNIVFFCGIKGFFTLKCKVILKWCLGITLNGKDGSFFKNVCVYFCVSGSSVGSSVAAVLQWLCSGAISLLRCPGAPGGSRPRRPELRSQQCPQPPSLCQVHETQPTQILSEWLHRPCKRSVMGFSISALFGIWKWNLWTLSWGLRLN